MYADFLARMTATFAVVNPSTIRANPDYIVTKRIYEKILLGLSRETAAGLVGAMRISIPEAIWKSHKDKVLECADAMAECILQFRFTLDADGIDCERFLLNAASKFSLEMK